MIDKDLRPRKLVGNHDLAWLLAIALTFTVLTTVVVDLARQRFELYRLGNEVAMENSERRRLLEEQRRLTVELERRRSIMNAEEAAREHELMPPAADQIVGVEAR